MSVEYFEYKCQPSELSMIIDNLQYVDRSVWESQRIVALYIAQKMVKQKIRIEDIFKLPWDEHGEVTDMKQYMQHIQKIEKQLNNKQNADEKDSKNNLQE